MNMSLKIILLIRFSSPDMCYFIVHVSDWNRLLLQRVCFMLISPRELRRTAQILCQIGQQCPVAKTQKGSKCPAVLT